MFYMQEDSDQDWEEMVEGHVMKNRHPSIDGYVPEVPDRGVWNP